jgi:uncharacterized protein (TIRG00374 family)
MKMLFSVLMSVFIVGMCIYWIGFEQFYRTFLSLHMFQVGIIFFLFLISIMLRGWRFELTLSGKLSAPHIRYFILAALHNVANQLMPVRSGELAYPYLLHRYFGYKLASGTASLLYVRFFELFVLIFLFLVAIVGFTSVKIGYDFYQVAIGVTVLALVAVIVWVNLAMIIKVVSHWLARKLQKRSGRLVNFFERVSRLLLSLSDELKVKKSPLLHIATGILTLLNWMCLFTIFYLVLHGVGTPVSVFETMIGSSVASLAQLIPVSTMGNFGSLEAGWTAGFMMVGVDMKSALNSGLIMHLIVFLCSLVLAVLSWLGLLLMQGRRD